MDLLQGYGSSSEGSDNDSVLSSGLQTSPPPEKKHVVAKSADKPDGNSATTKRGKRILSLGAVLPPDIFDRLTRPAGEDSSSSSSDDEDDKRAGSKKRKRATKGQEVDNDATNTNVTTNGADRTELNSFLSELRSTPMEQKNGDTKSKKNNPPPKNKSDKLGMAFMCYTETKHDKNEVVDVHAAKPLVAPKRNTVDDAPAQPQRKTTATSFSRISTAAPVQYPAATNYEHHYPQQVQHTSAEANANTVSNTSPVQHTYNNNNPANNAMTKSRKQRREEERALRSGAAFQNPAATTEIYQPSPTEFAPTAHAAAIASRAARHRGIGNVGGGGGSGSMKNIAMYDPQAGGDVKGLGITGKHRSKHQINSLMANAISLEAHRAAEAELTRLGGGGQKGNSRADAKQKYGW